MTKFTLLLSIFYVLTFQAAFSSTQTEMDAVSFTYGIESENQLQFEENHFSPNIFGEVASGHGSITQIVSVTKLFFSNFNSNDHQIGFTQGILCVTKVLQSTLYLGLATYSILLIPSYLQTGNLQI